MPIFEIIFCPGNDASSWVILMNITQLLASLPGRKEFKSGWCQVFEHPLKPTTALPMKKIGIYGGSFDPIHHGHIALALEMLEKHELDSVWLCPSLVSPFKQTHSSADPQHRLNMIDLAIEHIPELKVCDIELHRAPPSYTVDTLRELNKEAQKHPEPIEFYLIMGDDTAVSFADWREPLEILQLAKPIIGTRSATPFEIKCVNQTIKQAIEKGITPTRTLEISSSEIRQRLQNGMHVEHLIPESVYQYIKKHHLYIDTKHSHNAT